VLDLPQSDTNVGTGTLDLGFRESDQRKQPLTPALSP
jgi:hypothetical protein